MEVGLYFDMRNPSGWATDFGRLYGFTLEMCEEAERLGCHSIWLSEHHRFDDGYLPQPLTMAAAVAARTRTTRIGTAIVIAPLHHPAELAEQAAVVDIVSGGRLELGLGAGYRVPEFELYGADIARRYADTDGRAREVRRLWDEGVVTPGPLQERLPIWLGYQGPKGRDEQDCSARACSASIRRSSSPTATGWPTAVTTPNGLARPGVSRAGRARTQRRTGPSSPVISPIKSTPTAATWSRAPTSRRPGPSIRTDCANADFGGPLSYFLYGTPEEVAFRLQAYIGGAPVETVFFWASLAGMPEEVVARHVRTICTRVAPLLAKGTGDDLT